MILRLITAPLFLFANAVIALIPTSSFTSSSSVSGMINMFSVAFQFFPTDVWIAVFGSISFWVTVHLVYGLINFILKLIPLINMGQ